MVDLDAQATESSVAKDTPGLTGSAPQSVAAAGGVLGAVAASSCCILPLVLFSLGISGAWIGKLTALAPYQPIFIALTVGFLGYGYYLVFWKSKTACRSDRACATRSPSWIVKGALLLATVLVAAAVAFPYFAPIFLNA